MLAPDFVIFVCLLYVGILFAVAFAGDRHARKSPTGWLSSSLVYTLSISIYCTSWTFFGAVGSAATTGLEFASIYLGPTVIFVGWWVFLRKLVTIGRIHNTTSIADFISARFGKHSVLGALVTIVALVATAPYIALQLKALSASFQVITFEARPGCTGRAGPAARLHQRVLDGGWALRLRHHVRGPQYRRQRAPSRCCRRDCGRGRGEARRPAWRRTLGGVRSGRHACARFCQGPGSTDAIPKRPSVRVGSRCVSSRARQSSACRASFR